MMHPKTNIRTIKHIDEYYLPKMRGTTAGESIKSTPEGSKISTFVNFRMLHNREIIPFRGQRVQQSPILSGTDSPSWATEPSMQASGGWTFKTGNIDPAKLPDLIIDFEVMQ